MTSVLHFQLSCRSYFYNIIAAAMSEGGFGGGVEPGRFALTPGRFDRGRRRAADFDRAVAGLAVAALGARR
jgi:hypothetical protein